MRARMTFNQKFTKYWLPVVLWMSFIFWMSGGTFSSQHTSSALEKVVWLLIPGISSETLELIHVFIRKAAHVSEYCILGFLNFRAFRGGSNATWNWRWSFFALVVVVLCAVSDEFHQSFVPAREGSYVDAGIDTAGGLLAQLVSVLRHYHRKK